jgi:polyhydroxyalkanoate synthase
MADSRDHHDATRANRPSPYWTDWFERHAGPSEATHEQWRDLGQGWRAAVENWWQHMGDLAPSEGKDLLRQAVDQGKAFFELADGVTRSAGGGALGDGESPSRDDILWRLPLEIWERAAASALPSQSAYQRALSDYATMLRGVGEDTLKGVSESWQARRDALQGEAGLRELFDLCVDIGEQRYYELVASDAFAEAGGRLVNTLVSLVGDWQRAASDSASASGADTRGGGHEAGDTDHLARGPGSQGNDDHTPLDPFPVMATLGIAPERTLAELRAFGDKLSVALDTLQDIGRIDVGTSAREVVLRDGKLTLYHYRPTGGPSNPIPVLIVYALANRPYMMDLEPERSMIRALLDAGLDVYLIDWGYPDGEDRELDLDDYVVKRMGKCVQAVCRRHDLDRITLLGVCQGGTFSLCYSALEPDTVRNLVLMVTPVDFHTSDNLLTAWLRHVDVDAMVDTLGNIPGELLNWAFVSMKPLRLTGQKYLDMLDSLDDSGKARTFLRMEKWIHDSPAQAGEAFRQFAKALFQENRLIKGELQIAGRNVDLQRITMPVLNIYATEDHIVPPAASLALENHIASTDYTSHAFEGGHIGIYVSERAQRQVPPAIATWLGKRCS